MRVLIVDQDSTMLEALARALREQYVVDAVTNKGDCLDLLRQNAFEVVVAGERLEDGSGLELLGQVGKRWPTVLRIFAADPHRLKLLKGRLGPFELFQTLRYPVDPQKLLATLQLAGAARDADADVGSMESIELGEDEELQESAEFPAPRPEPRAVPVEVESPVRVRLGASSGAASVADPSRRSAPGRTRLRAVPSASPSDKPSSSESRSRAKEAPRSRDSAQSSGRQSSEPKVGAGQGTPPKRPPVRFPHLEPQTASAEAPAQDAGFGSLAEAARMAQEARSNSTLLPEESAGKRTALLIGMGAVALGVIFLGFKLFGSKSEPGSHVVAPAVQAPQYPHEVTDLVQEIETALKQDDFKTARADVDQLHQVAPSHPRLSFFEYLLARRGGTAASAPLPLPHTNTTPPSGEADKATKSSHRAPANTTASASQATSAAAPDQTPNPSPAATARNDAARKVASTNPTAADSGTSQDSVLPPETPPGLTMATSPAASVAAPASAAAPTSIAPSPSAAAPAAVAPPATVAAVASAPAPTPALATASAPTLAATNAPVPSPATTSAPSTPKAESASKRPSGEPPPVVREAKLIRRVSVDYPSAAKRDGIEGSVDLAVTVSAKGVVESVSVAHADPPDVFDKAALDAVRRWKYEPRYEDGLPAEASLKVHVEFKGGEVNY